MSGPLYAQKIWTLKECVDHAVQNNLNIRQQYLTTELAKINVSQNKLAFLPSVTGSASSSYNWGRSVDPFSYTFTNEEIRSTNMSLNGNLTLFSGLQLQNTLKQSRLDYLAGQSDLKKISNDISLNVVSAYLQVLFSREQLKVFSDRVKEAETQRDRTKALVDAGTMTRGNFLDAESQYSNEELNLITAENQYSIAILTLAQLLELDTIEGFTIQDPQAEIPESAILAQTPAQIYNAALGHLPEIKSADLRISSASKGMDIARGGLYPRLTLFSSYSTGYSSTTLQPDGQSEYLGLQPTGAFTQGGEPILAPAFSTPEFTKTSFSDQLDNNRTTTLGLNLSVPIFSGLSSRYNVTRARIAMLQAEASSELLRNTVYKSIQQAYADAVAAGKKHEASEKAVESFTEAFNYAEQRYNAGLSSSLEYLTATNNLTRAKTDLLQAKYDLIFKTKILDFYAGNPLTF